jgi:hypothetical protein
MKPGPSGRLQARRRWGLLSLGVLAVGALGAFVPADGLGQRFPSSDKRTLSMQQMIGWQSAENSAIWSAWDGGGVAAPWPTVVVHILIDLLFIAGYAPLLVVAIKSWYPPTGILRAAAFAVFGLLLIVEIVEMALLVGAAVSLGQAEAGAQFPLALGQAIGVVEFVKIGAMVAIALTIVAGAGLAVIRRRNRYPSPSDPSAETGSGGR